MLSINRIRCTDPNAPEPRKADGGVKGGAADPRALYQDVGLTADARPELGGESGLSCRPQSRRPLLDDSIGNRRHARGRGAGPGAVRKHMNKGEPAFLDQIEAAAKHVLGFGRKTRDQVGAERQLRAQRAGPVRDLNRIGAQMPPLHTLQDQVVARLQRQMQMRHQPLLLGDEPPQLGIDLDRIERGEAQPFELGHRGEQSADHLTEAWRPWQIGAIGGQIDPGQHDLAIAGGDKPARLFGDGAHRYRSAGPARVGDDAKGAAVVAALLDLQKGAGSALEAVDQMGRGLIEVGRLDPRRVVALRPQFCAVVEHPVDLRECSIALWSDLGGAAGDDDLRLGMPAASPADRLSRLPLSFGGDSAGIDDNGAL